MKSLSILGCAIVLASVPGCGGGGGAVEDAAAERDAGVRRDGAGEGDGGVEADGGAEADGGHDVDSGMMSDAGLDAGTAVACDAPIPDLGREPITSTMFSSPVQVVQPPGSTDLYVVERGGRIRIVRGGTVLGTEFIDLSSRLRGTPTGDAEWGLLSLAFHPDYAANGRFFVGYTPNGGDNVIAEGRRMPDDPDRGEFVAEILTVADFASNHNGGQVLFGPDGMLYGAFGDGGGANDPRRTGQDLGVLLGKIVRIDVRTPGSYAVPADNPFVGMAGAQGEIWAYGLRNPWRISFDRDTGDVWIGDVGQDDWEEIDFVPGATRGGQNFGWSAYEGNHVFLGRAGTLAGPSPHHPPITEYDHGEGGSVVGGYVYRGAAIPALRGVYLFGDSYGGWVRGLRQCDGSITRGPEDIPGLAVRGSARAGLVSFGEDGAGELYLVYLTGEVDRIVAR